MLNKFNSTNESPTLLRVGRVIYKNGGYTMIKLFDSNIKKFRTELLSEGFVAADPSGSEYVLQWSKSVCNINLNKKIATITKPDTEYNKQNIYSPRNLIIDFLWKSEEENQPEVLLHHIKKFCSENMI